MLPSCARSDPILGSTPVQAKQIAGGGSSHCICRASKGTRGEPCATCDETASGTRMSHSKRSDVANGSRRRRGMRGSYDGRRATCTATSGWGHEKARACVGECDGAQPSKSPTLHAVVAVNECRTVSTAAPLLDDLTDCRSRLLPPQHTVAATPAKPSTMATGQAPCGLSGGPAEHA
jgi:hypothetical protein